MSIEQRYVELIHADIDGEISESERADLNEFLQQSEEGRSLRDELGSLCQAISSAKYVDPPPHLRHLIMESVKLAPKHQEASSKLTAIFWLPPVRYAGAFAAGALLTLAFVGSDWASRHAFDDVTELVGTISETAPEPITTDGSMRLTMNEIAGIVSVSNAGPILIVDFDIVSHEPVRIVADFSDRDIWFQGFAQLQSPATTVTADTGQITLITEGRRRYAMYLHNAGSDKALIDLRFYVGDALIYEGQLHFASN